MSKYNATATTSDCGFNYYEAEKLMFQVIAEKISKDLDLSDEELAWYHKHNQLIICPFREKCGKEIECKIPRYLFEMGMPASRARCPYAEKHWECPIVLQFHGVGNN